MENKEIINNELLALANQVTKTFTSENETKSKSEEEIIDDNHDSDFKPPEVDWINLEAKLKEAQQEINIQVLHAHLYEFLCWLLLLLLLLCLISYDDITFIFHCLF